MLVYGLILIFAVIQSVFGVGILLFGTPALLILGYEYQEALLYLLPASAAMSWSQVWDYRKVRLDGGYRSLFFLVCIPCLILGMFLNQFFNLKFEIRVFITAMLFLTFALRSFSNLSSKLQSMMARRVTSALATMGFIHGIANMGGSILTLLVSSLYPEKNKIIAGVSFIYGFMATIQIFILILIQNRSLPEDYWIGSLIALSVHYLVGKRVFSFTE